MSYELQIDGHSETSNMSAAASSLEFKTFSSSKFSRRLDIPSTIEFKTIEDKEIQRVLSYKTKVDVRL